MAFGSQQYPRQQYTTGPASDRPLLAGKPVQGATSYTPDSRYASVAPSKPVADIVKEYSNFVKPIQTSDKPRSIESISNPVQSQASYTPSTNAFSAFTNQFGGAENIGSIPGFNKSTVPTNTGMQDNSIQANPEQWTQINEDYTKQKDSALSDLKIDIDAGMPESELANLYPDIPESARIDLYADIKAGMPIEEARNLYPEIYSGIKSDESGVLPKSDIMGGGLRRGISSLGSDWGMLEWINPVGKVTSLVNQLASKIPVMTEAELDKFSKEQLGGFGEGLNKFNTMMINAPGSFLKTLTATAQGITNPLDMLNGLYTLAFTKEGNQVLKDRYGSLDAVGKTMAEDPVGLASDILTIIQGGAGIASKGAKLAGASELSTKLGNISKTAGGAADLGLTDGYSSLTKAGLEATKGNKIANTVVQGLIAPTQPLKTMLSSDTLTRNLPEKVVENNMKLTPRERAKVEKTGVTAAQFVLKKGIAGLNNEAKVTALQNIVNESYNGVTEKFKSIPEGTSISDSSFNNMLNTMVDEMNTSPIVRREYKDYIDILSKLSKKKSFTPQEGLAIRRDFDAIVGKKIFDTQGRVSGLEDEIIAGYRSKANDLLQETGEKYGIDMGELNDNIRNGITIRDGLLRSVSQSNKNNYFGLQDLGIGAILSAGDPVTATAIVIGKKAVEKVLPSMAQKLYSSNKSPIVKKNIEKGASFISKKDNNDSRFALSNSSMNSSVLPEGQELKLKGSLPSKSNTNGSNVDTNYSSMSNSSSNNFGEIGKEIPSKAEEFKDTSKAEADGGSDNVSVGQRLETPKPKTLLDTIVDKKIAERKAKVVGPVKEVAKPQTPTKPQGDKPKNDVLSRAIDKVKAKNNNVSKGLDELSKKLGKTPDEVTFDDMSTAIEEKLTNPKELDIINAFEDTIINKNADDMIKVYNDIEKIYKKGKISDDQFNGYIEKMDSKLQSKVSEYVGNNAIKNAIKFETDTMNRFIYEYQRIQDIEMKLSEGKNMFDGGARNQKSIELDTMKEKLIDKIIEHTGLDQFQSKDIYDSLRDKKLPDGYKPKQQSRSYKRNIQDSTTIAQIKEAKRGQKERESAKEIARKLLKLDNSTKPLAKSGKVDTKKIAKEIIEGKKEVKEKPYGYKPEGSTKGQELNADAYYERASRGIGAEIINDIDIETIKKVYDKSIKKSDIVKRIDAVREIKGSIAYANAKYVEDAKLTNEQNYQNWLNVFNKKLNAPNKK